MSIYSERYRQNSIERIKAGLKLKKYLRYSNMTLTQVVQEKLGSIHGRP